MSHPRSSLAAEASMALAWLPIRVRVRVRVRVRRLVAKPIAGAVDPDGSLWAGVDACVRVADLMP